MMNTIRQRFDNVSIKFCILYCAFLLVIPSLGKNEEYSLNFTSGDERSDNSTMPYELDTNSMRNQDNKTTLMHFNLHANSVKNENETNFMPHERSGNSNENTDDHENNDDIIEYLHKMCNNTCIQHCSNLLQDNCDYRKIYYFFHSGSNLLIDMIDYACEENEVPFDITNKSENIFFHHSSPNLSRRDIFVLLMYKCSLIMIYNKILVFKYSYRYHINFIILPISLLCLLITFIVYSICPKQNMQGYIVSRASRLYVALLFVAYTIILINRMDFRWFEETYSACIAKALLFLFCYLAIFLWQNVICFDIFRTFRRKKCYLLPKSAKSNKKTFLKSSLYAWGIASTYVIICVAMDFVPNVPHNIRANWCNFSLDENSEYYMIPLTVIIVCNICFFIFTMLNIMYAKKDTDRFLKDSESKRHTDDKQRFMMYLKLFLLMEVSVGLGRIIKIIFFILLRHKVYSFPLYVLDIMQVMEDSQGIIILICQKKIMLKLFTCKNNCLYGKTSTSDNCHIATSHISSPTKMTEMSTQKVNSNMQDNCHVKSSSEVIKNTTI